MFKPSQPMMARLRLTTKQVGGGYYKGNRTGAMGFFAKNGSYVIDWKKVRTFAVPEGLKEFKVGSLFFWGAAIVEPNLRAISPTKGIDLLTYNMAPLAHSLRDETHDAHANPVYAGSRAQWTRDDRSARLWWKGLLGYVGFG